MKFGITLVVLTIMSMPLLALAGDEKSSLSDKQLTTMQKRLQLSDEQMSQMRKIRDEGGSKKEMSAVLTGEQKARAKEQKSTMTDERLSKLQKQLQLSDQQMSQMRKIRDEGGSKKEMGAVLTGEQKARAKEQKSTMTDERLSKLQKQLQLSDQQMSQMRKIREDGGTRKEILAELSNEQKAQLKEDNKNKKCGDKCEKKPKANTSEAKPAIKAE